MLRLSFLLNVMNLSLNGLLVVWVLIFGRSASASEIKVLGNDTQLIFGGDGWRFTSGQCSGDGYVATTVRGDSASFIFKGTGVSVSLLNLFDGALANVLLDGAVLSGNIDLVDPAVRNYQCLRKVVNSTELPNVNHNVTVLHTGKSSTSVASNGDWLALAGIVYTTINVPTSSEDGQSDTLTGSASVNTMSSTHSFTPNTGTEPPAPSSSGIKLPALIGGIIGGALVGALTGIVAAWCFLRKRPHRNRPDSPILPASHEPNVQQLPTPYYVAPSVSYPYLTRGPPWNSDSYDNSQNDMVSSGDRPTSMGVEPSAARNHTRPEVIDNRAKPQKRSPLGWNPSASAAGANPDPRGAISSPPPQYDFRGTDSRQ